MLRDERFIIAGTIVAITDLPRVRLRKLPKLASLSLGEALSLSHRSAYRDSSDTRGHNVQIDHTNRFDTRVDRGVRRRADRARRNRPRLAMGHHGTQR